MKSCMCCLVLVLVVFSVSGQPNAAPNPSESGYSCILGRPTDRSIALSVLTRAESDICIEYGPTSAAYTNKTETLSFKPGVPREFELSGLTANTRYYYRLLIRDGGKGDFTPKQESTFHTQRAPGASFTFDLQGDSHPERERQMYSPELYAVTMRNVAKDAPDFYVTLGDDFSIERLIMRDTLTQANVNQVYANQRNFLGMVGASAPVFLVNGNHEQAAKYLLDGTPNNAAVMAGIARVNYFPLPAPDGFYSGDSEEVRFVGLPRDYYSWTWGNALFVVIDPYWHSSIAVANEAGEVPPDTGKAGNARRKDLWQVTLGDEQFHWLYKTLTESNAEWKFVFCHHVLGTGRGGIEMADMFEWGGKNRRGISEFAQKRPGWELPVHQLMAKSGVTIFFQGHDHIFAHQTLDGVVYQSCPNPADNTYQAFNRDAYRSGDILPNSGHLRVSVSPEKVTVDYLRSWLPKDETAERKNDDVAFSYTIPAKGTAK